jgi:hypothetical protein
MAWHCGAQPGGQPGGHVTLWLSSLRPRSRGAVEAPSLARVRVRAGFRTRAILDGITDPKIRLSPGRQPDGTFRRLLEPLVAVLVGAKKSVIAPAQGAIPS